jgi:ArsR family transcriptional regulator, nickel/cobalt-responsive transcriptional repressor
MTHGIQGHSRPAFVDAQTAHQVAETMQALATPSRVRILGRLRDGACSVNELAAAVEMEASAVSHQLRVLRHLGLVVGERQGRTILYALHDSHVADLLDQAIFHIEHLRLAAFARTRQAS